MRWIFLSESFFLLILLQICVAPPVTQNKENKEENAEVGGLEDYMEYHRYLREVVNALESDPKFREKLEKAEEHDIRSGKIANELEFVSHHVRNQLDEIKRIELKRLKDLTEQKRRLQQNIDLDDPMHHHLDHSNPHTFEIEDLKKLIAKTTADLVEADKKRKEEFKQYELQKEYEKQVKLNKTNGEEREHLEKEIKEMEEKHRKHEKLHEPGHKAQLEEVWQEQDQMQQEFDPKTFFMLHDIDSNGLWDQDEVKALFVKELEKMYAAGEPEDDMRERAEEMERMRESVFNEVDVNRDGFIDYEEFLAQTKKNDFKQDHGWQALDEAKPYSDQELEEYIRQHQLANQVPQYPPHGYPQVPPGMPPVHAGIPQQQFHPGQVPPQQFHPAQVPPQQVHPGQVPPQQFHPGQVPQQQFHPGQVPQQPQQLHGQLNTNEIYPPQQAHQQVNYQQQAHQQVNYQQQPNYQQPPPQYHNQQQQQFAQQGAAQNQPNNGQQLPQQNNQQQQQQIHQQQQQQQQNYQQQQGSSQNQINSQQRTDTQNSNKVESSNANLV